MNSSNMNINEILNPLFLESLINMAATMDRTAVAAEQLKAIDELAEAAEKLYDARKKLYPENLLLALGCCLLRLRECQVKDIREQGGRF